MSRVLDNVSDKLDKNYRSYKEHNSKCPTKLKLSPEDLAELKEFLGIDFMEELRDYKGCRVMVSESVKVSHYE